MAAENSEIKIDNKKSIHSIKNILLFLKFFFSVVSASPANSAVHDYNDFLPKKQRFDL